jgi:hypothetical protein
MAARLFTFPTMPPGPRAPNRPHSGAQRRLGHGNPLGLHLAGEARCPAHPLDHVGERCPRLRLAACLAQRKAIADAGLDTDEIVGHRFILIDGLVKLAVLFQGTRVKQMPVRRLVVRPALAQIVKRRLGVPEPALAELGARTTERKARLVTQWLDEDCIILGFRLLELAEFYGAWRLAMVSAIST